MSQRESTENQATAGTGQMHDWRQDAVLRQLLQLKTLCMASPALALLLSYLVVGLLGLVFHGALLAAFGLNVLPYLELPDVLLAPLHHPQVLLFLLAQLSFLLVISTLAIRTRYRRGKPAATSAYGWLIWPVLLLYLVMSALVPAHHLAGELKRAETDRYQLQLVTPVLDSQQKPQTVLSDVQLISRNSAYWFVLQQRQLRIIPHSNVALLSPVAGPQTSVAAGQTAPAATQTGAKNK